MLYKRVAVILMVLMFALNITAVLAQDALPANDNFAVVSATGDLVIFGTDEIITVNNPPNQGFNSLVWNADGSLLAYQMYTDTFEMWVMVTDTTGQAPVKLETGMLDAGFPITFTPEGNILYVQSGTFPTDAAAPYRVKLMQIAPTADAQPQMIGEIDCSVGCGGGSPLPSDWQYSSETGGFGGSFLTLAWTPFGILYSPNCAGFGLALLDLATGEARAVTPDAFVALSDPATQTAYGRTQLSTDGTSVVGISTQLGQDLVFSLYTLDLATGTINNIPTERMPEQTAWGPDGSVFYAAREQVGILNDSLNAEGRATLETVFGGMFDVPAYQSSIVQVNLTTGEETQVYSGYAYAVGRMKLTNDSSALMFSIIPNMDAWLAGIADGPLDIANDDGSAQRALVAPTLLRLAWGTGEEAAFVTMGGQFALRPAGM